MKSNFKSHRGLYCKLFDSSCIDAAINLGNSLRTCSDRELLTDSEKVRTASSEVTRNRVQQAVLVAEVKNDQCSNSGLDRLHLQPRRRRLEAVLDSIIVRSTVALAATLRYDTRRSAIMGVAAACPSTAPAAKPAAEKRGGRCGRDDKVLGTCDSRETAALTTLSFPLVIARNPVHHC